MGITLEALQVLDTIERRGSFSAAAATLGKVPSALTYTVRRLEEDLDVLLFDRRGSRARLTAAGRELLAHGRELLRAADALTLRVRGVASGWEPELRIALDGVIAFDRIRPLVDDFHRLGAPTSLRFSYEVLDGSWDALSSGRAELAIGAPAESLPPLARDARLQIRTLGEVGFVFCVAPHHPLAAHPEPIPATEVLRHRIVAVADTARALPARTVGLLTGQPLVTVATMEQKISAQLAGLGAGRIPEPFARPYLKTGMLVAKDIEEPDAVARLAYAWQAAARGKALSWWLDKLNVERVRQRLLAGPVWAESDDSLDSPVDRRADDRLHDRPADHFTDPPSRTPDDSPKRQASPSRRRSEPVPSSHGKGRAARSTTPSLDPTMRLTDTTLNGAGAPASAKPRRKTARSRPR
jgi:DNA-binding transcriptional LysR family regulator